MFLLYICNLIRIPDNFFLCGKWECEQNKWTKGVQQTSVVVKFDNLSLRQR